MRRTVLVLGATGLLVFGFAAGIAAQMIMLGPFALGGTIEVGVQPDIVLATCETYGSRVAQIAPFTHENKLWLFTRCEDGRLLVNHISPLNIRVK